MFIITIGLIFLLLASVLSQITHFKKSYLFWIITTGIYLLTAIVGYHTESLHLPLGFCTGIILVHFFFKKELKVYWFTLFFGLVAFFLSHYTTPSLPVSHLTDMNFINQQIEKFSTVEYIKTFTPEEEVQDELRYYLDGEAEDSRIMLSSYMMLDQRIKPKNKIWLIYESMHDMKIKGNLIITATDSTTIHLQMNGEDYIGRIDTSEGKPYLKYVIKGQLKNRYKP
ncbi:hypothetical protein SAMN05192533_11779 [Mesobacillus persicus]|jgi:hypothetical protein|uniref:Uncharacterized protein n=1 Tax=Mesobacillus persicus TaxID=930146 RepID=A0A1H8IKA2_9BACI|nr:hypothetical protein [Mesobacillus persicus]SEN68894.1 hypothetical protein SAMN05192533_11779 [Mesobacillus persicus]